MNKNRLYIGLLVAVMLAVLVYASYGMVNAGKKESYYSVAVIVDDSSSDRWTASKKDWSREQKKKKCMSMWFPPVPF